MPVTTRNVIGLAILLTTVMLTGCGNAGESAGADGAGDATPAADSLVVYSSRKEHLVQPLFARYEEQTGTKIRFLTDDAGPLMVKLGTEAENTPADILITVDAGNLWWAAEQGLLQPVTSPTLAANVPPYLRDPQNRWFGISVRARTIVFGTQRVSGEDLSTYEALADEQWRGRVCLRTSKKVYNQSLVAMLIAEHGQARAEEIVAGWVANLAAPVFSSDNQVLEAIAAGQCDVGIVNTYYFGRLLRDRPDLPLALFWPNQHAGGVHVNVSGAGVTAHAPHREAALRFLEWLSGEDAQSQFAALNLEYPANETIAPDPAVQAWGDFERNPINVGQAGALQAEAVMLMDRAGYD